MAIIGMNKLKVRFREQLRSRPAQRRLPGWIDLLEIPVEVRDAEKIQREIKKPVPHFIR